MVHQSELLLYVATSEETEWGGPFVSLAALESLLVFVIPAPTTAMGLLDCKLSLGNGQGVLVSYGEQAVLIDTVLWNLKYHQL